MGATKCQNWRSDFIFGAVAGLMGTCFSVLIRMKLTRPDDQIIPL